MALIHGLPNELSTEILYFALAVHPIPSSILCTHSSWYHVGLFFLHSNLYFRKSSQLRLFAASRSPLSVIPRSFTVELAGGDCNDVFPALRGAFERCGSSEIDVVHLCLNSHRGNDLTEIYNALSRVNPQHFEWKGPDPPHHFSTAIVPPATEQLALAIHKWSRLETLTLRNIAFQYLGTELSVALNEKSHDRLRVIEISQAVFLGADFAIVMPIYFPNLLRLKCTDAYLGSIWGPRLRMSEVEKVLSSQRREEQLRSRVREVVRCEAKLERIIGGDRETPDD